MFIETDYLRNPSSVGAEYRETFRSYGARNNALTVSINIASLRDFSELLYN
jgi:hypothetical protein